MSCPADYRGERQVKPGNILQRADVLPEVPHLSREGSLYEEVFHFSQNVVAVPGVPLLRSSGRRSDGPALESINSQTELDKTIATLDAALFDAYNRCDLEKFGSFIADDVEFYHDQGGVTLGKEDLIASVRKNICGKVSRELLPRTIQVYHMKGYGAVEMGVHRFHHPGHDDTEPVGEGKFIQLWRYKDGAWKITRVISYDHHVAAK